MTPTDILADALSRIPAAVRPMLMGADDALLTWQPDPAANTIGWLAWHIARGQDAQIADLASSQQVWTAQGYAARFDLPSDDAEMGYGQDCEDVVQVMVSTDLLSDYLDAVTERSLAVVDSLSAADLDRVLDDSWDPPVTVGTRLVSVIGDCLEHAGQAAYLKGLHQRLS